MVNDQYLAGASAFAALTAATGTSYSLAIYVRSGKTWRKVRDRRGPGTSS
jgi:hypothetical protein